MRKEGLFLLAIFSLSLISIASAAPYYGISDGLGYGMSQLIDIVEGVMYPVTYALFGTSDYMFERILFLAIIISLISVILKRIPVFADGPKSITWIVTISVALLSTRFMVESQIVNAIILPYSVLGIVLTSALPLVIYYFFVQSFDSSVLRKFFWLFFMVVFAGIWGSRYEDVGEISWIYLFTAGAALIFLTFDGTIRRVIIKQEMAELNSTNRADHTAKLRLKLQDMRSNQDNYPPKMFRKLERRLLKQIERADIA